MLHSLSIYLIIIHSYIDFQIPANYPRSSCNHEYYPHHHASSSIHLCIQVTTSIRFDQRTGKRLPNQQRERTDRKHHPEPNSHLRQILRQTSERRR